MHICAQKYLNINTKQNNNKCNFSILFIWNLHQNCTHDAAISFSSLSTEAFSVFAAMKNNWYNVITIYVLFIISTCPTSLVIIVHLFIGV